MKTINKFLSSILLTLIIAFPAIIDTSCQKSPINGYLDGQWQIMSVEPETEAPSGFDTRLYYCFSRHVCQLSIPGKVWITGNMSLSENSLTISFPQELSEGDYDALKQYGITSNPTTFLIEKKDNKAILLKSTDFTVTLRKY